MYISFMIFILYIAMPHLKKPTPIVKTKQFNAMSYYSYHLVDLGGSTKSIARQGEVRVSSESRGGKGGKATLVGQQKQRKEPFASITYTLKQMHV